MLRRLVVVLLGCLLGGMSLGCASMSPRNMIPWEFETRQEKIDRLLSVARLHERHEQTDEATHIYRQVLVVDAKNTAAMHRLGVIAVRDGRLADAQQQFDQALASGKPSPELLGDVGYLYYLRHDLPAAEAQLRAALQADPRDRRSRNNLGLVLGEQGRFDEALVEFRQAGSEAEALANLAYVQSQMGQLAEAEKNYHQALERDNSLRSAAEALVQLNDMKAKLQNGAAGNQPIAQAQHTETSPPVSQFARLAHASPANRPINRSNPSNEDPRGAGSSLDLVEVLPGPTQPGFGSPSGQAAGENPWTPAAAVNPTDANPVGAYPTTGYPMNGANQADPNSHNANQRSGGASAATNLTPSFSGPQLPVPTLPVQTFPAWQMPAMGN